MVLRGNQFTMGWKKTRPKLAYKMLPQAGLWFTTGWYEFAMIPVVYEVVRYMLAGPLDCGHLDAPDWLLGGIYPWLRPVGNWRHSSFIRLANKKAGGALSFNDLIR